MPMDIKVLNKKKKERRQIYHSAEIADHRLENLCRSAAYSSEKSLTSLFQNGIY